MQLLLYNRLLHNEEFLDYKFQLQLHQFLESIKDFFSHAEILRKHYMIIEKEKKELFN